MTEGRSRLSPAAWALGNILLLKQSAAVPYLGLADGSLQHFMALPPTT